MSSAPNTHMHQEDLNQLATLVSNRQRVKLSRRQRPQRNKQRNRHPERIPRPINCFMAYRLEMQKTIAEHCPGANHRDISKIVAKWWRKEPEDVKEKYRVVAELAKQEHSQMYPNYKYTPRRKRPPTIAAPASESSSQQQQQQQQAVVQEQGGLSSPESMVFSCAEASPYESCTYGAEAWAAGDCWPAVMQDCATMGSVLHTPYYLSMGPPAPTTPLAASFLHAFPETSAAEAAAPAAAAAAAAAAATTALIHQHPWVHPSPSTSTSTISTTTDPSLLLSSSPSTSALLGHQHSYDNTHLMDYSLSSPFFLAAEPGQRLVERPAEKVVDNVFLEDSSSSSSDDAVLIM